MSRRNRRGPSGAEPTPLDALLAAVSTELTGATPSDTARLIDDWAEILGPDLADGIVPVALVDGVLNVAVADPARRAQLQFEESVIVARVNAAFGRALVSQVRSVRSSRPGSPPGVW